MATYFSDLHCHTTLFAYNRRFPDAWHEYYFPIFPVQGNFAQLARGKVRVVMSSLYPIEQGFVTARPFGMGTGNITDFLAKMVVDIPKDRADEIQKYIHDYYDDLMKELAYLQASAQPVTHKIFVNPYRRKSFSYRIVANFEDLRTLLALDAEMKPGSTAKDTIAVILTLEGAHSLGIGQKSTFTKDPSVLKMKVGENILKLKNLGPAGQEGAWCPFFITLSHHFWNQMGGHAVSLWKTVRKVLDQNVGINEDITELGKYVVEQLLDDSNGKRRILIDSAHMCYSVRKWYYSYLESRGDNIPVIISHTAVNGIETMEKAQMIGNPEEIHDVADRLYDESVEFNPWDDFVSDEEIMIVYRSKGIIGLILDQRIMMGKVALKETKRNARFKSLSERRKIWAKPYVRQILYIANHIHSQTGHHDDIWDNISLGSDFNGMITTIKHFTTADKLPLLERTMLKLFKEHRSSTPKNILTEKTDEDIREIVNKVLWKNNLLFLERNFK